MKALLCILGISFALCGCHKQCSDNKSNMKSSRSHDRKAMKQKRVRPASKTNNPNYSPS